MKSHLDLRKEGRAYLPAYWQRAPGWGSVGVSVGWFHGIGVEVDVVEMLDFLASFAAFDLVDDDERQRTLMALTMSQRNPHSMVPRWKELLGNRERSAEAAQTLIVLGPDVAVPALLDALESGNEIAG